MLLLRDHPRFVVKLARATAIAATAEDYTHSLIPISVPQLEEGWLEDGELGRDFRHARSALADVQPTPADAAERGDETFPFQEAADMGALPAGDIATLYPASCSAEQGGVPDCIEYNSAQGSYECRPCGFLAFSLQAISAHARHRHGFTALASLHAGLTGECLICLRKFPNRIRLVNHLKTSAVCMLNCLVYRLLPSQSEREESAAAGRREATENKRGGRAVSYARGRFEQMLGPLRPLYIPSGRAARSTNSSLAAALQSGYVLPTANRPMGGIARLIAHA
jgi:hypothetical protein